MPAPIYDGAADGPVPAHGRRAADPDPDPADHVLPGGLRALQGERAALPLEGVVGAADLPAEHRRLRDLLDLAADTAQPHPPRVAARSYSCSARTRCRRTSFSAS